MLESARHAVAVAGGHLTLIRVQLPDRRANQPHAESFLFQNQVERALFGCNSGGLYRLYQR